MVLNRINHVPVPIPAPSIPEIAKSAKRLEQAKNYAAQFPLPNGRVATFLGGIARSGEALSQRNWIGAALCSETDPEIFFPAKGISSVVAIEVCKRCEVTTFCRQDPQLRNDEFGVIGGQSSQERDYLRRSR